jgi:hypothetical protein
MDQPSKAVNAYFSKASGMRFSGRWKDNNTICEDSWRKILYDFQRRKD